MSKLVTINCDNISALVGDKLSTGFPWITTVWLENNDISHEGVSLLAKGFERVVMVLDVCRRFDLDVQHETLTDLSLAGNPIRKEGLQVRSGQSLKLTVQPFQWNSLLTRFTVDDRELPKECKPEHSTPQCTELSNQCVSLKNLMRQLA